jgi:hypothetical protein
MQPCVIIITTVCCPHIGQHDQQPAEEDYPHEGSRGQAPQHSSQAPSSERLPLQQQSPTSSVATPCRTTQHQLSSSTDGQQTKLGRQSHHAYILVYTHTHMHVRTFIAKHYYLIHENTLLVQFKACDLVNLSARECSTSACKHCSSARTNIPRAREIFVSVRE